MAEMGTDPRCECITELSHIAFCEDWDSYWCRTCARWLEGKCSDPDCETCPYRPLTHNQVIHDIP